MQTTIQKFKAKCKNGSYVSSAFKKVTIVDEDLAIELTVDLSPINLLTDKLEKIAEKVPGVKKLDLAVGAGFKYKAKKKCCPEKCVTDVEKYQGTVKIAITPTLAIPGWEGDWSASYKKNFFLSAGWLIGPSVTLSPEGSASLEYEKDECANIDCFTGDVSVGLGLGVKFGGEVDATVLVDFGRYFKFHSNIKLELSASGTSSISGVGKYSKGKSCPKPGFSGLKVCMGKLTAAGKLSGEIVGVGSVSLSITKDLLDEICFPKEKK